MLNLLRSLFYRLFPRTVFPGDAEKTRVAAVSNDLIGVMLVVYCLFGLVATSMRFYANSGNIIIGWVGWTAILLLRTRLSKGWVHGVSFMVAAIIAAAAIAATWRLGTVSAAHTAWAHVAIAYCVMTVGPRAALLILVATMGAYARIAWLQLHAGMVQPFMPPPFAQWAVLLAQTLIVYTLGWLVRHHMIEAVQEANLQHQALELEREQRRRLLESANRTLEMRVSQRTAELRQANVDLQRASQHLIQSEKLAALGGLVAGVAHELNTPIGNARLTATGMAARMEAIAATVATGRISRREMEDFLSAGVESMHLIERATVRAGELVDSFKQVAVDQTGMQRRSYNLRKTVDQTVQMLGPVLRRTPYTVHVEIDPAIELDGFPGAVEQIINNLVDNALLHAFAGRTEGNIRIHAGAVGDEIELGFEDDGAGMSEDVRSRVFEPFFTTKFGQGGSGLGLYTVYNLVTSVFGGSIEVHSGPARGARFVLRFPRQPVAQVLPVVHEA